MDGRYSRLRENRLYVVFVLPDAAVVLDADPGAGVRAPVLYPGVVTTDTRLVEPRICVDLHDHRAAAYGHRHGTVIGRHTPRCRCPPIVRSSVGGRVPIGCTCLHYATTMPGSCMVNMDNPRMHDLRLHRLMYHGGGYDACEDFAGRGPLLLSGIGLIGTNCDEGCCGGSRDYDFCFHLAPFWRLHAGWLIMVRRGSLLIYSMLFWGKWACDVRGRLECWGWLKESRAMVRQSIGSVCVLGGGQLEYTTGPTGPVAADERENVE